MSYVGDEDPKGGQVVRWFERALWNVWLDEHAAMDGVAIEFTDATGIIWRRTLRGALDEVQDRRQ
jgi:hypothetical protein